MAVTCRDCALPFEVWPDGGCPNCGSAEPAGTISPGETSGSEPAPPKTAARTRPGRRAGAAKPSGGSP